MGKFFDQFKKIWSNDSNEIDSMNVDAKEGLDEEVHLTQIPEVESLNPVEISMQLATEIPIGFKWDETKNIEFHISVDTEPLNIGKDEILKELTFTFEDEGESHTIMCNVPIAKVYYFGNVFTNTIVSGFEPLDPVQLDDSNDKFTYTDNTAFSKTATILVNETAGYACNYIDISERNFDVDVTFGTPYMLVNGSIVELQPATTGQEAIYEDDMYSIAYKGNEYMNGKYNYELFIPVTAVITILNEGS